MTSRIIVGDCRDVLRTLPAESVHCCVTSPPYFGLRNYNCDGQIGLEPTPDSYVAELVAVFREVRRVLRSDGVCWLNLGDSYAGGGTIGRNDTTPEALARRAEKYGTGIGSGSLVGSCGSRSRVIDLKPKDLIGIPWRVAFALQADGWYLRQDIIWSKPNPMPESVRDRCTKAHEYLFLLSKSTTYYYDADAIAEVGTGRASGKHTPDKTGAGVGFEIRGGFAKIGDVKWHSRNKRSVWEVATQPYSAAHFATFPPALIEPCIKAGTSERGCCAKCDAPWGRQVERTRASSWESRKAAGHVSNIGGSVKIQKDNGATSFDSRGAGGFGMPSEYKTIGWSPSCRCDASVVPCTVLDPFGGAGTTGLVADRLQRSAILVELNPEYATMAERRLNNEGGMFCDVALETREDSSTSAHPCVNPGLPMPEAG